LNKREKEKKKKAKGQKSTLCSAQGFILTLHTKKENIFEKNTHLNFQRLTRVEEQFPFPPTSLASSCPPFFSLEATEQV